MSDKYIESRSEQIDEDLRSAAILDYDELMLLRSIHGKLDGYRMIRRERSVAGAGEPRSRLDLDLRLIW
ncbi:MAG: hypothetical protein R6X02_06975 [Enhygromyxa sp.]